MEAFIHHVQGQSLIDALHQAFDSTNRSIDETRCQVGQDHNSLVQVLGDVVNLGNLTDHLTGAHNALKDSTCELVSQMQNVVANAGQYAGRTDQLNREVQMAITQIATNLCRLTTGVGQFKSSDLSVAERGFQDYNSLGHNEVVLVQYNMKALECTKVYLLYQGQ